MKFNLAQSTLKILVVGMYALTALLFVPSPQTDNISSHHKSKNIDNIVHLLCADLLDVDQALERFDFSGFDDAIDVIDIHNHLHLGTKPRIKTKSVFVELEVKRCIGEITKYYDSYKPDLSTPPPQV